MTALPMPDVRTRPRGSAESPAYALTDRYGRVARDLRVSLTDRCNLRCTYCMPAEGLPWLPTPDLLTDAEILRLIDVGVSRLGITTVRLTGGEPLLRKNLEALVAGIAALRPRPVIAMTTNGIGLARRAEALAAAGLDRINISLDTLDPDTFARLSRRRRLPDVLAGIRPPAPPDCTRSRSTRCCCAGSTTTRPPICCTGPWPKGCSCGSSSRCRWTPSTAGDAIEMVTAAEIRDRLDERGRSWSRTSRTRRSGAVRRPSCSGWSAPTMRWASSPRCRSRSAALATGSG